MVRDTSVQTCVYLRLTRNVDSIATPQAKPAAVGLTLLLFAGVGILAASSLHGCTVAHRSCQHAAGLKELENQSGCPL